jgi:S-methylmethionine-dependent homocysteine/selenocysteine methylase
MTRVTDAQAASRPILLDGGMGRELRTRGVAVPDTIWSAAALITDPDVVRKVHEDYIEAGADVITTNTYGLIRRDLAKDGIEDRFADLNRLACRLADEARSRADRNVAVAGSLPPLRGSFRPDRVGPSDLLQSLYREQIDLLAPHVDLLLCETMSSAAEARAAATAACATGKPVWVAFTLHEDRSGRLRSAESLIEAFESLSGLPISGFLANCCAPESITAAMGPLAGAGVPWFGGYANTFEPIPEDWVLDGDRETDGALPLRDDLDPEAYADHVRRWLAKGATVVGGCCGTGPAHIDRLRRLIDG